MTSQNSSPPEPARVHPPHPRRMGMARMAALAVALAGLWLGTAAAHGTLVRGSVTLAPDPPRPGQPMVLTVDLARSNDTPVEGAKLVAELSPVPSGASAGSAGGQTIPLQEYKEPYGTYRAEFAAPPAGSYSLTVQDRSDPGERATVKLPLLIGGNVANGNRGFAFPDGTAPSHPLATWLIWLVAVPLAVGILVWALKRRTRREETLPDGDEG